MRAISDPYEREIAGYLLPWRLDVDQPHLMDIGGEAWVAIYSDVHRLTASMSEIGVRFYRVKKIDDGREFLATILPQGLRVCIDPRYEGDKLRLSELTMERVQ